MEQRIIRLAVRGDYIIGAGAEIGAAGSHDEVILELDFRASPVWHGLAKKAVFYDALGQTPTTILLTTDLLADGQTEVYCLPVPYAAKTAAGDCFLTLEGAVIEGSGETASEKVRIVTGEATFQVLPSKRYLTDPAPVTPTQAEQLQAEIDDIKDTIADAKTAAAAAAVSETNAKASETKAAASESAAAASEANAAASKAAAETASGAAQTAQGKAEAAQSAAETAGRAAKAAQSAISRMVTEAESLDTSIKSNAQDAIRAQVSAEAARDDAETYANAAQVAKRQAQSSRDRAEAAQTAAEEAQEAAEEASGLANNYQLTAIKAAQAAQAAQTAAETARDAAQTARGNAEKAKSAAQTAQETAEAAASRASSAQLEATQAAAQAAQEASQAVQAYGDGRYANALTAEVSGQGIILDDAWTVAPKDMSLQGITDPSAEPSPAAPATLVSVDSPLKLDRYGKNLWTDFLTDQTLGTGTTVTVNADGSVTLHKVAGKGVMQRTNVWLPAGTYTLSGKQPGGAYLQVTSAADSTEYLCTTPAGKGTGKLTGGTYRLMLYAHADIVEDVTIYPQLELGSQATAYEQFTRTVYQIPLTDTAGNTHQLQGAKAAGDRIFKDTDGLWKIEKRMAEKTLRADGFDWTQYSADNPTVYSTNFSDAPMGFQTSVCTHFKNVDRTWSPTGGHQAGEYSESLVNRRKWFRTQFDTLAAWTAWLEEQNTAGTPVKLVYALEAPTVYTLSAEAQAALNSITFSQAETAMWAENTARPAIRLTYVRDTNVVIGKLQNAIAAMGSV